MKKGKKRRAEKNRKKRNSAPHPAAPPRAAAPPRRATAASSSRVRVRGPRVAHRLVDRKHQSGGLGGGGDGVVLDQRRLPHKRLVRVDDPSASFVPVASGSGALAVPVAALSPSSPRTRSIAHIHAHARPGAVGAGVRRAQPVQDGRRVEPPVVAQLPRDRFQGFREGREEKLVAAGDGPGVLAEVAGW